MLDEILLGWTPLAFAAMGALLTELAGVLCICIEAFISTGAFLCYSAYMHTGSIAAAVLFAAFSCGLLGFLLSVVVHQFRLNLFVAGLAFSLAAEGLCVLLSQRLFGNSGVLRLPASPQNRASFFALALGAVLLTWFVVRATCAGRRLRAAGLSAGAVIECGLNPQAYYAASWACAGILSALAGCAMLFRLGAYVPYGTSGRGWLALAAVFMGFKKPVLVAACCFVFALASVVSSGSPRFIPPPALPAIPYLAALVLYVLSCAAHTKSCRNKPAAP